MRHYLLPTGEKGSDGVPGSRGPRGERGEKGNPAIDGDMGEKGILEHLEHNHAQGLVIGRGAEGLTHVHQQSYNHFLIEYDT